MSFIGSPFPLRQYSLQHSAQGMPTSWKGVAMICIENAKDVILDAYGLGGS